MRTPQAPQRRRFSWRYNRRSFLSTIPVPPMLARLEQNAATLSETDLKRAKHALMVLPQSESLEALRGVPGVQALAAALARRRKKPGELAKSPVATDLAQGTLVAWVMLDPAQPVFERQTALRKALQLLLGEKPGEIAVGVFGTAVRRRQAAALAVHA